MQRPESLFYEHHGSLLAWVRRKLRGSPDGDDIAQEAWLRATPAIASGAVDNGRAYVFGIARNLIVDRIKAERRTADILIEVAQPERVAAAAPLQDEHLIARERLALLATFAEELPPRCREVFQLRKNEGLSPAAIGVRLGISRNMVEKHLRHALLHCATRLGEVEQ
jgi:RNA polymerase sigma factor (sigma-70 family)